MNKRAVTAFALATLILASCSALFAQSRHRRSPEDHFFLPPRNFFFVNPRYYPPIRFYSPYSRHDRGYSRRYGYGGRSGYSGYSGYGRSYYPGRLQSSGVYTFFVQSPPSPDVVRANTSDVIFKVDPPRAHIYIDDKLIGSARDFSTEKDRYMLVEGEYDLRIEYPGYKPFEVRMEIVPNKTLHLDIELEEKDD